MWYPSTHMWLLTGWTPGWVEVKIQWNNAHYLLRISRRIEMYWRWLLLWNFIEKFRLIGTWSMHRCGMEIYEIVQVENVRAKAMLISALLSENFDSAFGQPSTDICRHPSLITSFAKFPNLSGNISFSFRIRLNWAMVKRKRRKCAGWSHQHQKINSNWTAWPATTINIWREVIHDAFKWQTQMSGEIHVSFP